MYSSGQLAKQCHVSVRTVQYYDRQGLLHATRTAHNHRQYQQADLLRLQQIITYRQLGFSIKDIKELLDSQDNIPVLQALIKKQQQVTRQILQQSQLQIENLSFMEKHLDHFGVLPQHWDQNLNFNLQQSHKLHRFRSKMLIRGAVVDLLLWGSLAVVVWQGVSISWFIVGLVISLLLCLEITWAYYHHARYLCPHCQSIFVPHFKQWFWAAHTPNTRKLKCPECHQKSFCIEEYR
ncbi:transcriptional regulator, MerR family [Limosilactobacillus frumenti DSM 13145]|uniref:Transcriptional regulator, MerR family n=1 Tax=Limosilactobacillus frumenti DSM 13145 TaxID=1423746 RepID=A0A0R1PCY0_9LACO|nr:MerR family transcriptional regulator [Limosilactobacillus frumenti]KRL27845.1 transcriptional regulator, MerR family [Limosilactobacillus frumenti DSM 13145]MBA2914282.1 MerR family transcriptional regulator [Limosilactobacillus frumenti]QFG71875.1 MerR family transcriptional regulator [Limosilactobacillus frumenti]